MNLPDHRSGRGVKAENPAWHCQTSRAYFFLGVLSSFLLFGPDRAAATVIVNGAETYQTIEGFGVNINSYGWTNHQLLPVINALINQAGFNLFQVIVANSNWEATNDNADANVMNWDYYNTIYDSPDFQKLWGMMGYLNQQGVSNGLILKVAGPGPLWMGGLSLNAGYEDEYAETIASMLVYARLTEHLQFTQVRAVNEPDNTYTGVNMSSSQYVTAIHDLGLQLDANGMSDIRFSGPDLAGSPTGWMSAMMEDDYLMSKVAYFGIHSYQNETADAGGIGNFIQQSAYPEMPFWMTEYNVWCPSCQAAEGGDDTWQYAQGAAAYLLTLLGQGASAGIVYEAYDSQYYGYDPDTGENEPPVWYDWGLFGVDDPNAVPLTYTPREIFYTLSQISRYVRPGAQMIDVSGVPSAMTLLAFYNPNNGQFTLTGVNSNSADSSLSCQLASLPAMAGLNLIYTTSNANLANGGYVPMNNNTFSVVVPANSVFTLTYGGAPLFLPPTVQNGAILLTLSAAIGSTCQINASTDLVHWTALTTIQSTNGTIQFTDPNASAFSHRYYRALLTN